MALRTKLSEEDLAVLDIIEDPIMLGEFLRTTRDLSPIREEWPKKPFTYRWYQAEVISDKSETITFTAGRAVGKCSPASARVYTYPHGYKTIHELHTNNDPIVVYTMRPDGTFVHKRAKTEYNSRTTVFRIKTRSGYTFDGTGNHPLLTPKGFVEIQDLKIGYKVAVMERLPHESLQNTYTWEELRWLGYVLGMDNITPESIITVKYPAQVKELEHIAAFFDTKFVKIASNKYKLQRKRQGIELPHPGTIIIKDLKMGFSLGKGLWRLNPYLKAESKDQLKIMLESFFSNYATIDKTTITLWASWKNFILDIQELLLYYGIKSEVTHISGRDSQHYPGNWRLHIDKYEDYYRFFTTFTLPGITVSNLVDPEVEERKEYKFESIISIDDLGVQKTYTLSVPIYNNYISDNLIVHNSLVMEDKLVYESLNTDIIFPETKEQLLSTANISQMTPILDRIVLRFGSSPLLQGFLQGKVNRSKGTLDFPQGGGGNYRLNARIAGSKGENNVVSRPLEFNNGEPLYKINRQYRDESLRQL